MRSYRLSDYLRSRYPDPLASGFPDNEIFSCSGGDKVKGSEGLKLDRSKAEGIKSLSKVRGDSSKEVVDLLIKWLHYKRLLKN